MENKYILNQHAGATSIDINALPYLKDHMSVKSLLDIGCGPGGNVEYARSIGVDAFGIDGDQTILPQKPYFSKVDYSIGSSNLSKTFDIGWSVEFAEHIEERYIENFMRDYKKCSSIIFTAAPPGWGGVGHVNEQKKAYWIKRFEKNGFSYNPKKTTLVRRVSCLVFKGSIRAPKKQFVKNRGLVFDNLNLKP
tara:strand:+ start:128 stop:706 length:579 start_codon:yes stop_codon:yes gene_type:complete